MKILIGTPIHECKDYSMERWLENVSKLKYPADLYLVDNSPTLKYIEKVDEYCKKYRVKNYKIDHFVIDQELDFSLRIEKSEEIIREAVLLNGYDAWFSWECDILIPSNTLDELIRIMNKENFMMVCHNCWLRIAPTEPNADMGVTLIKREALQKSHFLPIQNGRINFDMSEGCEDFFRDRVLKNGGNYAQVFGKIKPIYHLDK